MAHRKRAQRIQSVSIPLWRGQDWEPDLAPAPMPWRFHEVPVAVVAHPDRSQHLDELALSVTAEAVVIDDNKYGCEINHLRAWDWLSGGNCPWSVVIEDDALPVERFRHQLHAALKVAPTPIVSLYLGRTRTPHWQQSVSQAIGRTQLQDACFLAAPALLHGVGYAIRTALIPDLLFSLPCMVKDLPIDEAITTWAKRRNHAISYTWPSLVDHRDEPSLVNHRDGQPRRSGRKAWHADWREKWEPTLGEIAQPEPLTHRKETG